MVQMLLGKGAAVDQASTGGLLPLQLAAINGHWGVVQVLLEAEAKIWDEGFPNVAGELSRATVKAMKRSICGFRAFGFG